MSNLGDYIEGLVKEAGRKTVEEEFFQSASMEELAQMAGIKMAMSKCRRCGSEMEKMGSVLKCSCGMMKASASSCPGGKIRSKGKGRGLGLGKGKGPMGVPVGLKKNKTKTAKRLVKVAVDMAKREYKIEKGDPMLERIPAAAGMVGGGTLGGYAGTRAMGALGRTRFRGLSPRIRIPAEAAGFLLPALAGSYGGVYGGFKLRTALKRRRLQKELEKGGSAAVKLSHAEKEMTHNIQVVLESCNGDIEKAACVLEDFGFEKKAVMPVLRAIGKGARGMWRAARGTGATGQTLGQAATKAKAGLGEAGKAYGAGIKNTWQTAQRGGLAPGVHGPVAPGKGGLLRAIGATAKAHPELAVAGALPAGYVAGKTVLGSANAETMIAAADAAGRLLAKVAEGVPGLDIDELKESIQEAQEREDIPGRAGRWQIGGGVAGGLAGSAIPLAAGALMRRPGLGAMAAMPAAAGGAYFGQRLGKQHGAQEAIADKAVSMLRAMRAGQSGAREGYRAGFTRGIMSGGATPFEPGR